MAVGLLKTLNNKASCFIPIGGPISKVSLYIFQTVWIARILYNFIMIAFFMV